MRVQHLDDDPSREQRLLGEVDVGHAAAPEATEHAIATTRGAAQLRELGIRLLEWGGDELREAGVAARARRGGGAIPGTAVRAEHDSAPELHANEVERRPGTAEVERQARVPATLVVDGRDEVVP